MTQDTSTYYVWIGGSCDYGHKERAGGAAVVIELMEQREQSQTCLNSAESRGRKARANSDLIIQCIEEKKRHNSVGVKIVQYHKSPLLIETHDRATEAMAKTRKEFHQKNK